MAYSDHWAAYDSFLPPWKHQKGKQFAHIIESFNATIRHYLAHFHRKTHCYSKSLKMLELSLWLLFNKDITKKCKTIKGKEFCTSGKDERKIKILSEIMPYIMKMQAIEAIEAPHNEL